MRCGWLCLIPFAFTACQQPPAIRLAQFSQAAAYPSLLGPIGDLRNPHSSLYLMGWPQEPGELPVAPARARVRLFCTRPQPAQLVLVGCSEEGEVVDVRLGSHLLGRVQMSVPWRRYTLEVPESALVAGENLLLLEGGGPSTTWSSLLFRPAQRAQHFAGHPPRAEFREGDLLLPFGSTLEFPLELIGQPSFQVDGVVPWCEAGASPPEQAWLQAQACTGLPEWSAEQTLNGRSKQAWRLRPPQGSARLSFSLTARAPALLKPGQLGLKLLKPRISGIQAPERAAAPLTRLPKKTLKDRPNVILYVVDTLRGDHVNPKLTPQLARLAQDGCRFEQVQAQSCWTKPSVASILTSLSPEEHQCLDFGDRLSERLHTLGESFHQAGYQVHGVVTNVYVSQAFGYAQGFEHFHYMSTAPSAQVQQYVEQWLQKRDPNRPFFLYVHSFDPHLPYEPPRRFLSDPKGLRSLSDEEARALARVPANSRGSQYEATLAAARRLYADEVRANDHSMGLLMECLKARKLYDSTMIAVTSDHGEEFLEHGLMGHNTSLYQELLEVPWILKLPHQEGAGTSVAGSWQHLDIAPTLLYHAGLEVPKSMRGQVFRPADPPTSAHRTVTFSVHSGADLRSYQPSLAPWLLQAKGVRQGPWVLIQADSSSPAHLQPLELYNLENDPQQKENLAYRRPEVRAYLAYQMQRAMATRGAPSQKLPDQQLRQKVRELPYLR